MRAPAGVPLVAVTRGPLVESVHAVAACAADPDGTVAFAIGDVDVPVFLRSAAKPFIAAAIVRSGAADRFAFDDRELATIAASHGGEPFHTAAVAGILTKLGLPSEALRCGVGQPSYEPAARALAAAGEPATSLHHNCSGKHAGLLALAIFRDLPVADYLEPTHPVQREILAFCARILGVSFAALPLGVDGCGIPVFATSLRRAATAFARLGVAAAPGDADAAALARVRDAMAARPAYVAGTDRFDSALIATTAGRIVAKAGAEGVHGTALRERRLGLVLKVVDGAQRAAAPAALAFLAELGALEPAERVALDAFARPAVRNAAGRVVGEVWVNPDTMRAACSS